MYKVAASSFTPSQQQWLISGRSLQCLKGTARVEFIKKQQLSKRNSLITSKTHVTLQPATYSSTTSTDIPLYETPAASFDEYLADKARVFDAIFPDKPRSHQLNEEEWRIQMLPIQFLYLTVWPVIDMRLRCKSNGKDYPPYVPSDISKVLQLDITRWELRGLDSIMEPSHFNLGVRGSLYPDRRGARIRLKGHLDMNISFVLPPMLALIPEDVRRGVAESVLNKLVENMKYKVNGSLLADYSKFKRERPRKLCDSIKTDC